MAGSVRFIEPVQTATDIRPYEPTTKAKVVSIEDSLRFVPERISIDDLYTEPMATGPELGHALRGLATAKGAVQDSLDALQRGEWIASDDAMQRVQAMMPELFCCRALGDGFGAVVNALKFCFENAKGGPFSKEQVVAIGSAVERLRAEPFMAFGSAVEIITRLEDSGLNVDPPAFAILTGLLDVEGLH
jgi:hypothetical protein